MVLMYCLHRNNNRKHSSIEFDLGRGARGWDSNSNQNLIPRATY